MPLNQLSHGKPFYRGAGIKRVFTSVRDFTVMEVGYSNLFEGLRDLGVGSFELYVDRSLRTSRYVDMGHEVGPGFDVSTRENRARLRRVLEDEGVSVCAILVENDFSRELGPEVEYVVKACEVASDLGVSVVRINAVMREAEGYTLEDYVERTAKAVKECLARCGELGVSLAVENHGVIANRREFLRGLLESVGSELLGLTLDTGNFYWYGYPLSEVYEIIEEFAGHVKHTHLKNARVPAPRREETRRPGEVEMTPLYEGDIDLRRVLHALRKAGYDYDANIEDESLGRFKGEERKQVLKRDVAFIKEIISGL